MLMRDIYISVADPNGWYAGFRRPDQEYDNDFQILVKMRDGKLALRDPVLYVMTIPGGQAYETVLELDSTLSENQPVVDALLKVIEDHQMVKHAKISNIKVATLLGDNAGPEEQARTKFTFDLQAIASITIPADDEDSARRTLRRLLENTKLPITDIVYGDVLQVDMAIQGEGYLYEVDGRPAPAGQNAGPARLLDGGRQTGF